MAGRNFEVRWTKAVVTSFFGNFVNPGGSIFVPATLAIQLHEEKQGWECADIKGAKASLDAKNILIPGDARINIDDLNGASGETGEGGEGDEIPPAGAATKFDQATLEAKPIGALRAMAKARAVELAPTNTKAEIVAAILASQG